VAIEINADKVSAVLLRGSGEWLKVKVGTFIIGDDEGLVQFEEDGRGSVTTTVVARTADVVATKRTSGEHQTRVRRAVVM